MCGWRRTKCTFDLLFVIIADKSDDVVRARVMMVQRPRVDPSARQGRAKAVQKQRVMTMTVVLAMTTSMFEVHLNYRIDSCVP